MMKDDTIPDIHIDPLRVTACRKILNFFDMDIASSLSVLNAIAAQRGSAWSIDK